MIDLDDVLHLTVIGLGVLCSMMFGFILKVLPLKGLVETLVIFGFVGWWMWCGFAAGMVLCYKDPQKVRNRKNGCYIGDELL